MSRAQAPASNLHEEPFHQESPRPAPEHSWIHGYGQQFRTNGSGPGAVAKGLHDPTPGPNESAAAGERDMYTVTKEKRPIEAADV